MSKSPGSAVLRELVKQFPNAGALTLAKKAYRDNPEYWPSLEACRSSVRSILGVNGQQSRQRCSKTLYRKPRAAGWSDVIPEALVQLDDWKAVAVGGPARALILSDIHIPFHDPKALELALQYGLDHKADLVLLNGDVMDFYAHSHWEKDPKLRDFPAEVRAGKHFLGGIRKRFPHAQIIFKEGNHEERYLRHMRIKAPDFLGLPEFSWPSVFGLKEYDIQLVDQKRPIRLGLLNVIHGHEYVFSISNPVNPARGMYLRAKAHVLGGHFHQPSQHTERTLEQKVISAWSTGCLCNIHPEWRPLNPWGHGFAFVVIDKDGSFKVDNLRIINGKTW